MVMRRSISCIIYLQRIPDNRHLRYNAVLEYLLEGDECGVKCTKENQKLSGMLI